MKKLNLLLLSLLTALCGCQPETPAKQVSAPVAEPAAASAPTGAAGSSVTAVESAPVQAAADVVEKAVKRTVPPATSAKPAVSEEVSKPAVAEKPASAPAVAVAKVAPVEVAQVAAPAAEPARPDAKAAVSEAAALALAKKNNCLVCHAVDKKVVGPAWKDVAAKYRGDAKAEAYLVNKIARGGSGAWGSMPMPANTQISETERRTLARFVLNLR